MKVGDSARMTRFRLLGEYFVLTRSTTLGEFTYSDSLPLVGCLRQIGVIHHATLCVIPSLASEYSGATGSPSSARHALYKSVRNRLTM